ncbi:hypothetical protein [Bacillus toyonensis]|uniref:hypothetical protein n=1 Tax=Bacillus toyonensis TaxID=155322 RepID=UPI000BFA949C|nr:hypothetical protein [Bacillus toyonensis]PGF05259.1 hypothetical protein COM61_02275 [Bacillus toyonensis]
MSTVISKHKAKAIAEISVAVGILEIMPRSNNKVVNLKVEEAKQELEEVKNSLFNDEKPLDMYVNLEVQAIISLNTVKTSLNNYFGKPFNGSEEQVKRYEELKPRIEKIFMSIDGAINHLSAE